MALKPLIFMYVQSDITEQVVAVPSNFGATKNQEDSIDVGWLYPLSSFGETWLAKTPRCNSDDW